MTKIELPKGMVEAMARALCVRAGRNPDEKIYSPLLETEIVRWEWYKADAEHYLTAALKWALNNGMALNAQLDFMPSGRFIAYPVFPKDADAKPAIIIKLSEAPND